MRFTDQKRQPEKKQQKESIGGRHKNSACNYLCGNKKCRRACIFYPVSTVRAKKDFLPVRGSGTSSFIDIIRATHKKRTVRSFSLLGENFVAHVSSFAGSAPSCDLLLAGTY